ncbi:hypothetical protein C8Q74DRAFT_397137 [Fomes fomentarius]|nr:hypothetical protein C8Q74DRAFT_397137 [Fomes fomentarius]
MARIIYMNVPAVRPPVDQSFEEQRYQDYVQAYIATRTAPRPVPPLPADPQQRVALGLPPLFEPYSELEGGSTLPNGTGLATGSAIPAGNLEAQAFSPTKLQEYGSDAIFHSIVAQREYSMYSFEELRWEAYRVGKKTANVPPAPPIVQPQRPPLLPSVAISSSQSVQDSLQSVNSVPPYDQHSFEELRLAYIRAGRPLTSAAIFQQNTTLRMTV